MSYVNGVIQMMFQMKDLQLLVAFDIVKIAVDVQSSLINAMQPLTHECKTIGLLYGRSLVLAGMQGHDHV